jgi:hypothetical protein
MRPHEFRIFGILRFPRKSRRSLILGWPAKGGIQVFFSLFLFLFLCPVHLLADAGVFDLRIESNGISASLSDIPLGEFLGRLQKEKDIWVKGAESLTEEKVSADFEDLPLEEGLGRILSGNNYSLFYDDKGSLMGIVFLGRATPSSKLPGVRPPPAIPLRRLPPRQ